jgi:hypothetical protein
MSGGTSWAYEEAENAYNTKVKAKIDQLQPYQLGQIVSDLLKLRNEPMTRAGHQLLDRLIERIVP